ncbi:hypothetical protein [Metabacillus iocasae]|uniref:Prolipoprotein diacylglyceryltransferase n=1 Tax=Priestia iocasae TaxID=2291674 RepID=A0ABS2QXV1_9BACI|nr:hypothetical protein [Metabacillus iocasae]MBM7703782.1 prolipoprotein diacylglyceryltransferase [Metabacillus iocasae]
MFHEAIQIGPLLIKYGWIAIVYSIFCGFILMKTLASTYESKGQEVIDLFFNGLLLFFFVFKFSILIKDPSIITHNPYGLLFFHGGMLGIWIGGMAAILYIVWTVHKKSLSIKETAFLLTIGCLSALASYAIQHYWLFT